MSGKNVKEITEKLSFDARRKLILWDGRAIRYRLALLFIPRDEVRALEKFLNSSVDEIASTFNLV